MKELITWCYSLFNPWVIALSVILIPSLAWHLKSLREHMKTHIIKWQWIIKTEKKPKNQQAELDTEIKSKGLSTGWQVAAILVIVALAITCVTMAIHVAGN